jgi:hypothetical protein
LRPEKNGALIIIQTVNRESALMKIEANFGPDQPGRTGHENDLFACHETTTTRSEEM